MSKSTEYHDYVFRDGKLVGEFEEMYRNSETTPWHQDKQDDWIDVRLTKQILQDLGRFAQIHDFGCGTGHYLDLMAKHILASNGKSFGYDVSATACEKAATIFPNSKFAVMDFTQQLTQQLTDEKSPRLFMIRGTLWYVVPKLATVVNNLANLMTYSDHLLVVQNFPPLQKEFIGKDIMPDHFALIEHFSTNFTVDRHIWFEDHRKLVNDNWFIGLFTKKK